MECPNDISNIKKIHVLQKISEVLGDSLVLHCTSLLRMIFTSLAHAFQRVRVQNVRNFLQIKLDTEINAPFLLNDDGDPHFLFHNFNENTILSH